PAPEIYPLSLHDALPISGARPGDHIAHRVGDRDDRVVERALDVGVPMSNVLLLLAADLLRRCLLRCAGHYFFPAFFLPATVLRGDRKSTRLNSSHQIISY